jgi:hypothetical protein
MKPSLLGVSRGRTGRASGPGWSHLTERSCRGRQPELPQGRIRARKPSTSWPDSQHAPSPPRANARHHGELAARPARNLQRPSSAAPIVRSSDLQLALPIGHCLQNERRASELGSTFSSLGPLLNRARTRPLYAERASVSLEHDARRRCSATRRSWHLSVLATRTHTRGRHLQVYSGCGARNG